MLNRIEKSKRTFQSEIIDKYIKETCSKFKDLKLKNIFTNCYPNTLDTTVDFDETNNDTFITTGDIRAMWLRDSSFQIFPYLKFCKEDEKLNKMILGLFNRQLNCIKIDPYANAFNKDDSKSSIWEGDLTYKKTSEGNYEKAMNNLLWERKFELDSIIIPFYTMCLYINSTGNSEILNEKFFECLSIVLNVIEKEKRGTDDEDNEGGPEYIFQRIIREPFDSLHLGRGNPCKTNAMIKSSYRNSDDCSMFPFNIPENALLVVTFNKLSEILELFKPELKDTIDNLKSVSKKVCESIYSNGVFRDENGNKFFAFEVDGFGNYYFMDEPGYPSLISLPFFGFLGKEDEIYINTRRKILSERNPYFIKGKCGEGVSSSHGNRRYIWTLFTIMRGLTSNDKKEIEDCLNLLVASAEKTGFMHESFNVNNAEKYTREWFCWANSFFGVFVDFVIENFPEIVFK